MLKKNLSLMSCFLVVTLVAASALAADSLSDSQLEHIEDYVRSQLDGNVVGYQFAIAQDGQLLHSYSHGLANQRRGKVMQSSYRLNIGSISKVVTTVTALKLAELGHLDLDAPFTNYLRKSEYVDLDPTIQQITVRDLFTYTSGLPVSDCYGDCPDHLQKKRRLQDCRVTLDIGESRFPYRCAYKYQNANFHLLRMVIQGTYPAIKNITNPVDTTAELVGLTRELWLNGAGLGMGCDPDPSADMRYYTTCDLADYTKGGECLDGTFHEYPSLTQSKYCSSGGWRASATELAFFLARLRDGQILGPEMTEFLLDTTLEDGYGDPGSTSAGFDRPWSSDDSRTLSKNGGLYLLTAYATLLPDGVSAALLINTENSTWTPNPGVLTDSWDVLKNAWEFRDGPRRSR